MSDFAKRFNLSGEAPHTDRGLKEYLNDFDLKEPDLAGKRILDVGSGIRKFAFDVNRSGLDAKIISFDPLFALDENERLEEMGNYKYAYSEANIPEVKSSTVAGIAEEWPFEQESFDLILCSNSVPLYFANAEDLHHLVDSSYKSLKKRGQLRINPGVYENKEKIQGPFKEVEEKRLVGSDGADIDLFIFKK